MKKLSILSIFFIAVIVFTASLNSVEGYEFSPTFIALEIRDDYIYYNSKFHISRDCINGLYDSETIFENNDFIITYINVTDDYIFFVNRINDYEENKTDIQLYRIKHDGSDMQIIYEEKIEYTNIGPQYIFIIDDVLLYSNQLTGKITAMDFEGNVLNWDL